MPDHTKKGATLDEIARELGYNKTTISRVISGKGRISAETRRRVQAYIDERGFRPNALARSLANSRTYNLGVLVPRDAGLIESSFLNRCLTGICAAASARDFDVLMVSGAQDDTKQLRRVLDNGKAEGLILVRSTLDPALTDLIAGRGVPFVVIGPADDGVLSVDNDNAGACRALTARVLRGGAKNPALLGGERGHRVTHSRLRGYLAGCADCGVTPDPALILSGPDPDAAVDALLKRRADAVFCMDEVLCALLMLRLKDRSVRVPGDLKVACFYDGAALKYLSPSVTALRFDAAALGRRACEALIQTVEGRPAQSAVLPDYEIIPRASTEV